MMKTNYQLPHFDCPRPMMKALREKKKRRKESDRCFQWKRGDETAAEIVARHMNRILSEELQAAQSQ